MQANVRTNDLLNAFEFVQENKGNHASDASVSAAGQTDQSWHALVGEQYYARKQQLIMDEQSLLRAIDFNIVVQHPHKYLLNFAQTIQASRDVTQLAVCLLNDSLSLTSFSISSSAPLLAVVSLHLASQVLNASDELPPGQSLAWWKALGISTAEVEAVSHAMLDALTDAAESA